MATKRILVTGATGAVGVPLVRELLDRGAMVAILSRSEKSAQELQHLYPNGEVHVILGDVKRELCGIQPHLLRANYHAFDSIVHAAGDTSYHEHLREKTMLMNVGGTGNARELAKCLDIPRLVFVSTCYVAGRTSFLGEDEVGDVLNSHNPYEESKILAEDEARRFTGSTLIARLSTVLGHSETGEIATVGGYSGFVKGFWGARKGLSAFPDNPFWVGVNPGTTLNLVTSDWTARHLASAVLSELEGTVHLSHTHPVEMDRLFAVTFGEHGINIPVTYNRWEMLESALNVKRGWRKRQAQVSGFVDYFGPYVTRDTVFGHERVRLIPDYEPPALITNEILRAQLRYMTNHLFPEEKETRTFAVAAE